MEKIKGIDVSTWQGKVDWEKVKASGIGFALLRCGYGMDLTKQDDDTFQRNADECERLGVPYGVYLYSYANTVDKAKSEAAHVLRLLKGRKPEYPVYWDLEDPKVSAAGKGKILEMAKAFVETVEAAGYWVGIYANLHWWETYLTDGWYDTKARWVAQYYKECQYRKEYGIWQYTSTGRVPGVSGDADLNWCYLDYPKLMREAGLNGFAPEGQRPSVPEEPTKKSVEEMAKEVIAGKWGNGEERFRRLAAAGYDGDAIQEKVNELMAYQKKLDDLALEVYRGEWGNGQERERRLTEAGYDYNAVQNRVNTLYG